MPIDILTIILVITAAVVWAAFIRDVIKYPDVVEVKEKCKFCVDRWKCPIDRGGVCVKGEGVKE